MPDEPLEKPVDLDALGVDLVVHMHDENPFIAHVGGRRILLVPPSPSSLMPDEISDAIGVSPTDQRNLVENEDVPVTVFSPGGTTAFQTHVEDDDVPPTPYGPGGVPARLQHGMLVLDLDHTVSPDAEYDGTWEARRHLRKPRKGAAVDSKHERATE